MQFSTALQLQMNDIQFNPSKQETYKLLANSMLGKFAQRSQFPQTLFVNSQEQIEEAFAKNELIDFFPVTNEICQLEVLPNEDLKRGPKRSGNCVIAAFVTAYGRIHLHKTLLNLKENGFEPYYVDTDSIIFAGPKQKALPLSISPCLGEFKHELGAKATIQSFACLGRKNYCINYKVDNTQHTCTKTSGLLLSSTIASQATTGYENILLARNENKVKTLNVPQIRQFVLKEETKITQKLLNVRVSNEIDVQRFCSHEVTKETVPFGYLET